jgi:hypothetical protein
MRTKLCRRCGTSMPMSAVARQPRRPHHRAPRACSPFALLPTRSVSDRLKRERPVRHWLKVNGDLNWGSNRASFPWRDCARRSRRIARADCKSNWKRPRPACAPRLRAQQPLRTGRCWAIPINRWGFVLPLGALSRFLWHEPHLRFHG